MFEGDGLAGTSLCPALGHRYSLIRLGACPSNLQQPQLKDLPISVMGTPPYIISNKEKEWIGGTDFVIMDIYAKKFGFTPKFLMASSFDDEGGQIDMVANVVSFKLISHSYCQFFCLTG